MQVRIGSWVRARLCKVHNPTTTIMPPNARPGVTIMARAPNGKNVRLTVPHGVPPGATITVRY